MLRLPGHVTHRYAAPSATDNGMYMARFDQMMRAESAASADTELSAGRFMRWLGGGIMISLTLLAVVSLAVIFYRAVRLDRQLKAWTDEKEAREARLAELDREYQRLTSRNHELKDGKLADVLTAKRQLEQEVAALRQRLAAARAVAKTDDDDARLTPLRQQLAALESRTAELRDDRDRLQAKVSALQQKLDDVRQRATETARRPDGHSPDELQRHQREVARLKVALAELRRAYAQQLTESQQAQKELDRTIKRAKMVATEMQRCRDRKARVETEVKQLQQQQERLQSRLAEADGLQRTHAQVTALKREVKELKHELNRKEKMLAATTKAVRDVKAAGGNADDRVTQLELELYRAKIESLQAEKELLEDDVDRLRKRLQKGGGNAPGSEAAMSRQGDSS